MKRCYSSFGKVYILFFILLISIVGIVILLINKKIVLYKVFNGMVVNVDEIALVLNDNELELFNKNKKIFIDNKKISYNIIKINANVLEKEEKKYNQVYIKVDISDMYEVNDIINISIMEKNVESYKIFSIIWDGD